MSDHRTVYYVWEERSKPLGFGITFSLSISSSRSDGNDSNWSAAIFILEIGARQGATTPTGGDPLSRHVISFDFRRISSKKSQKQVHFPLPEERKTLSRRAQSVQLSKFTSDLRYFDWRWCQLLAKKVDGKRWTFRCMVYISTPVHFSL